MEKIERNFLQTIVFKKEIKAINTQTNDKYLSKADFKTNWSIVQKRIEKEHERSKKTIKIVADNTDYLDKLKVMVEKKAEKEFVSEMHNSLGKYARYSEMKDLY